MYLFLNNYIYHKMNHVSKLLCARVMVFKLRVRGDWLRSYLWFLNHILVGNSIKNKSFVMIIIILSTNYKKNVKVILF